MTAACQPGSASAPSSSAVAGFTSLLAPAARTPLRPRLGFLGVGWIGRHRLEAIAASGLAEIAGIADVSVESAHKAAQPLSTATVVTSFEELLNVGIDGIVIATPSALHAEQAITALNAGVAVFCQKPLGRNATETRAVLGAAQAANRLLGVDLSYRFITAAQQINQLCRQGELGQIYAAELVFHNAYGPDKPWFYDRKLAGGGCVIDLGIHLLDLALWNLDFPAIQSVTSRLFAQGLPLSGRSDAVEDFAEARLDLTGGATVRLACSWNLPAGRQAVIRAEFYGTKGGVSFQNVGGSFYRFQAERFQGTTCQLLASGDEPWGGRAAVDWARRLAAGGQYNSEIETLALVAQGLDAIYDSAALPTEEVL